MEYLIGNEKEFFEFVKKINSDDKITLENAFQSPLAKVSNIVGGAIIYFRAKNKPLSKIYELLKNKNIKELEKFNSEVENEIQKCLNEFEKNAEYYSDKNLYIYFFNSKFPVTSILSSTISSKNWGSVVIILKELEDNSEKIKVSARCQSSRVDMNILMKKSIEGFKDAVVGGHVPAAGATFLKKDLNQFKKNILLYS